ncbi:hypothetical protein [Microbacterium thalassium]|uniref:Putative secreted protein n=1 Tax=Microbacterium thalassium TaxID=362649 RepID=A0A7X0FM18_9MICO|nr:hypothetical protein [Microbacterium thalassium]MBB6389983.1 putative secreted protein [Microbacterium thalassium]GLK24669.1 hypothetical protein GCM10017607_19870 [Microbacterium thalassium]
MWMVDEVPARMFYAGRRWRVTDMPTRLRGSIWEASVGSGGLYGWRFQATDAEGESFVFDVYKTEEDWHVHRAYP